LIRARTKAPRPASDSGRCSSPTRSTQVVLAWPSRRGDDNRVADADLAVSQDVGVEAAAVNQVLDDAWPGQRLQVQAGLAQVDAEALDVPDPEVLAHQIVQPHAPHDDLAAGLGTSYADLPDPPN